MATLKLTQVIKRPVADVFECVTDAGSFASWNPTIKSSRRLTPGDISEGSQFEWELRGFGKVRQELREFERNRQVRIVPHSKAISGGHRFLLTQLAEGTRVDHELEMTPQGLYKLMAPMMAMAGRKNLAATAEALQRHLESN
jgi:uncharacterized protein YndB with AHSA1/START domain